MDEQTWSVWFEQALAEGGDDEIGNAEVQLLEALEALDTDGPVTGGGAPGRIAARFCVMAPNPLAALEIGAAHLQRALAKAQVLTRGAVDAQVVSAAELELDNATPGPDQMGAVDVAALLGVSRQRVYQLAAQPDFPAPAAVLARGEVWRRRDLAVWRTRHWNRKLGRPAAASSA